MTNTNKTASYYEEGAERTWFDYQVGSLEGAGIVPVEMRTYAKDLETANRFISQVILPEYNAWCFRASYGDENGPQVYSVDYKD